MSSKISIALSILFFCASIYPANLLSQDHPISTRSTDRTDSGITKLSDAKESLFGGIKAENIGPTVFSGRVTAICVNPKISSDFYVAYASGGLWHTINNGTSFEPLFDHEIVMTIGDIAVNWDTNEIWIGTGEVNSSRSSYSGIGMYYSNDAGKTWTHKGLNDTQHIGKIIIDPIDKNTVYVASLGHLYSSNEARGIYKTVDNGDHWEHILNISEDVGSVDMIMDPQNSNILYASSWERTRRAWNFTESGIGSGIYKSIDSGKNWKLVSMKGSGFPHTEGTGRIGLSMTYDGDIPVIYALLDNYDRRVEETKEDNGALTKDDFKTMSKEEFLDLPSDQLEDFLDRNFPEKYNLKFVKKQVKKGRVQVKDIALYLEDANKLLFDTPVKGAELYKSIDGGISWNKTHENYLDRVYNSYGYYFGLVRVVPNKPNSVYIAGVPLLRSDDGGVTFNNMQSDNVHADHHALWINPKNDQHIINGNDGGINISYDGGEHYIKCNSPAVGQFYAINVDNKTPYNVYGGLQDNGVWYGSHQYQEGVLWHHTGQYPYRSIMGGDGMQIQIDHRDNSTVYTGYQFGNYYRLNMETEDHSYITPRHELGERPYRWNWQSPILLSSHNQDIVYMGANKLMRSMNQGEDFVAISPDLTKGGIKGDVAYGTLTSISESTFKFGLMYTGSDDGMAYRTNDAGTNWTSISDGLPADFWVSRIIASQHDEDVVYLALNGYRWDNFSPLLYRSDDQGKTWTSISSTLPMEPINVIIEDPYHEEILYVGTDHGSYISTNSGKDFQLISSEIPFVAVHDMVVQKRDKDLLIGTHGRSIYKIDLEPIHAVFENNKEFLACAKKEYRSRSSWGNKNWLRKYNLPKKEIYIYSATKSKISVSLQTEGGKELKKEEFIVNKGYNYYPFDFAIDLSKEKTLRKHLDKESKIIPADNGSIYVGEGNYKIVFKTQSSSTTTEISIK